MTMNPSKADRKLGQAVAAAVGVLSVKRWDVVAAGEARTDDAKAIESPQFWKKYNKNRSTKK